MKPPDNKVASVNECSMHCSLFRYISSKTTISIFRRLYWALPTLAIQYDICDVLFSE